MKNSKVNLHIKKKRMLFLIASFSLLSFLLGIFVITITNTSIEQINGLLHSNYILSALTQDKNLPDSYIKFKAGIGFSSHPDLEKGIHAEVIMQNEENKYKDALFWKAEKLNENQVAISDKIAKENKLSVGDKLYSKHIVSGEVQEYLIVEVVKGLYSTRVTSKNDFNGVIIMGYDSNYCDNISHNYLAYSNEPFEIFSQKCSDIPIDIIYKDEEINNLIIKVFPFFLISIILSIIFSVGFIAFTVRGLACNYKRLIILGFEEKILIKLFNKTVIKYGIFSMIISLLATLTFLMIMKYAIIEIVLVLFILIAELITLIITSSIKRKQLWRG